MLPGSVAFPGASNDRHTLDPGVSEITLKLAVALFLLACATRAHADPDQAIAAIRRDARIPVVAWILIQPGRTDRVVILGDDVSLDTPMRWGSITKTFAALTLMQVAEQAGVPLTTPVVNVLDTGLTGHTLPESMRLENLITLSAGHTDLGREAFADNTPHALRDALQRYGDALRPVWPPALVHSYSNATPGLTEAVIETLTRQTFDKALKQSLAGPLHLASASVEPVSSLPGGYQADGRTPIPYWHVTFRAFGALNLSPRDMGKFLRTVVDGGVWQGQRVWSRQSQHRLLTPQGYRAADSGLTTTYAAGTYGRIRQGFPWHTHGGDADGYRSRFALLESHHAAYAIVINTDNPQALAAMETVLEKHLTSGLERPAPPPAQRLAGGDALSGWYYPAATRFAHDRWRTCALPRVQVEADEQELRIIRAGSTQRLLHIGGNRFRAEHDPQTTEIARRTPDGARFLFGEYGDLVKIRSKPGHAPPTLPAFMPGCLAE